MAQVFMPGEAVQGAGSTAGGFPAGEDRQYKDILLSDSEIGLARECLSKALEMGAAKVRVTLSKSRMDLVGTLDGAVDKINSCQDRSLSVSLFAGGRYGSFTTNRCDGDGLDEFLRRAFDTVSRLVPDEFRDLPDPARVCSGAGGGDELGLFDKGYCDVTPGQRVQMALDASVWGKKELLREAAVEGAAVYGGLNSSLSAYELVSEEGEYSDSICDTLLLDSQGAYCRHIETNFDYGVEVTVKDGLGRRLSRYAWDSATRLEGLDFKSVGPRALSRAVQAIGPRRTRSRRTCMVIDRECSAKVVSPLLRALSAFALQQGDSFLVDTLGKKVFPEGLTILDRPHITGESGSRLFDSEGVATVERPVIEAGVVKTYFVNTYMSGKTGLAPTVEDASRPVVLPWVDPELESGRGWAGGPGVSRIAGDDAGESAGEGRESLDTRRIMELCGEGILVTDFNGGNYNSTTGDFSYGVEGFAFKNGRITHPVREMVVTGKLLSLWQGLLAAGNDARRCSGKLVGTLAFRDVDFAA